ncbi:alpha/beta fold hydrolase [Rhodobacteraceae bacterium 63075]|nr:alpha/beta fold hydrolase [Rhodobacteraceae bacterium 63075]
MPLLRVNFRGGRLRLGSEAENTLSEMASAPAGPIVIMVHGYKFLPGDPRHCPHEHIFSLAETHKCWKATSWPRGLGFGSGQAREGLAIAFGWDARGPLHQVYDNTRMAAKALAELIDQLARALPAHRIHAIGHSLGGRVLLQTLQRVEPGRLSRLILLNPAEYRACAEKALASAGGRQAQTLIVTSGENALFDLIMRYLVWPDRRGDVPVGHGIEGMAHVKTLRIDCPRTLAHLGQIGFPISGKRRKLCHWSPYLRDGTFDIYRALFRDEIKLNALVPAPAMAGPALSAGNGPGIQTASCAV